MTRQCAWCSEYFSLDTSQPYITHGICEDCAEQIRHSMQEETRSERIFSATKTTHDQILHLR